MKSGVDLKAPLNPEAHLELEWLETNGLGGYASSTPLTCHTRKYHGLFVSSVPHHEGRYLLLSELAAALVFDDEIVELSTNRYNDVLHPGGYTHIDSFSFRPSPTMTWKVGRAKITRQILMPRGERAVYVKFGLKGRQNVHLRLRPLMSFRDSHGLTHENEHLRPRSYRVGRGFSFSPYPDMPTLEFQSNEPLSFLPGPFWEKDVKYEWEARRGFDCQEDRFCPGTLEFGGKFRNVSEPGTSRTG